jgi:hypothetical protein
MNVDIGTAILSVLGTLLATVIGAFIAFRVQSKVAERNRIWVIQDAEIQRKYQLEDERKRIKQNLVTNRLKIVEDCASLLVFILGINIDDQYGIKIQSSDKTILEKRQKYEEISSQAYAAIKAIGSQSLEENYNIIARSYWTMVEVGGIESEDWQKTREAYHELIKTADDLKCKIE